MAVYPNGRSEFELERMVTSLEEAKNYAETRVESLSYEVQQLRAQLNNAEARISNLEALLDECRQARDENETEVHSQEAVMEEYVGEIAELTQENEELKAALASTTEDEERFAKF